jgi:hypothetical protein
MRRTFYLVISKRDDEDFVETIRTEKKSAEQDVSLLREIVRRAARIEEVER